MNWLEKHITLQNYDDRKAEMENAVTHFIGAGLSIIGFIMILFRLKEVGSTALKAGLVIFALSNILLYTASGLYHYLMPGNAKRICRILDHSNIYFLMTLFMWFIALCGVAFTLIFWGRLKPLHPILYLIMGWTIVFFWNDTVPYLPHNLIYFLIAGGVTYSLGVVFYAIKKIPHYHAIWHVFVLLGSIWFYIGIYSQLI